MPGSRGSRSIFTPDPSAALDFFAITPCRAVDTRVSGVPIHGFDTQRSFPIAAACGLPPTARAVAANVPAVNSTSAGHLSLLAGDLRTAGTSVLSLRPGITRGNNAVIALGANGDVFVEGEIDYYSYVDVVIDIFGYFQ